VLAVDWKEFKILWHFAPEEELPFYASPALTDNLVVAGSRDRHVYALSRADGNQVWNFATRGDVDSSPVVVGNRVFVCSLDKNLYVLGLEKGDVLEKIDLRGRVVASPAVGGRSLVIGTVKGDLYCFE
jgi:outer membrane protein assembly factor BamB